MYEELSKNELINLIKLKDDEIIILKDKIRLMDECSNRDFLTGLRNRNCADEGHANASSIILCDVDNFKLINDLYGHNVGDLVLKEISSVLISCVRDCDYVIRWGGEEFLIFVSCDLKGAYRLAQRIREKVKDIFISYGDVSFDNISMSFGVSSIESSLLSDVENADKALYYSKKNGKDMVTVFKL